MTNDTKNTCTIIMV